MKSLANPRVISDVFTVVNRLSVGKEQMLRNLADAGLRCHYALSQFFARPEMGDVPGLDGHLVSRGRVASGTRWVVVQAEATEAPDLDALPVRQRLANVIE